MSGDHNNTELSEEQAGRLLKFLAEMSAQHVETPKSGDRWVRIVASRRLSQDGVPILKTLFGSSFDEKSLYPQQEIIKALGPLARAEHDDKSRRWAVDINLTKLEEIADFKPTRELLEALLHVSQAVTPDMKSALFTESMARPVYVTAKNWHKMDKSISDFSQAGVTIHLQKLPGDEHYTYYYDAQAVASQLGLSPQEIKAELGIGLKESRFVAATPPSSGQHKSGDSPRETNRDALKKPATSHQSSPLAERLAEIQGRSPKPVDEITPSTDEARLLETLSSLAGPVDEAILRLAKPAVTAQWACDQRVVGESALQAAGLKVPDVSKVLNKMGVTVHFIVGGKDNNFLAFEGAPVNQALGQETPKPTTSKNVIDRR